VWGLTTALHRGCEICIRYDNKAILDTLDLPRRTSLHSFKAALSIIVLIQGTLFFFLLHDAAMADGL
jgi:hypothetical protein